MISMIEDIIKLSRLDENQVELEKKDVDLYELMFQIKTDLDHKLKKEDVTFHIRGRSHKDIRSLSDFVRNVFQYL